MHNLKKQSKTINKKVNQLIKKLRLVNILMQELNNDRAKVFN